MNVQATMANKANEITGITNSVGPLSCGCHVPRRRRQRSVGRFDDLSQHQAGPHCADLFLNVHGTCSFVSVFIGTAGCFHSSRNATTCDSVGCKSEVRDAAKTESRNVTTGRIRTALKPDQKMMLRKPPAVALRLTTYCYTVSSDSPPRLSAAIAPQFKSG